MDNDKSLILNVLDKISSKYQDYSGRKRKRLLDMGLDYYNKQLEIYKKQSKESLKAVQTFAIEQDLSILPTFNNIDMQNSTDLDFIRVSAVNEIREIDELLLRVSNSTEDPYQILYKSSLLTDFVPENILSSKLEEIDSDLENLRATFTENDYLIKDKIKQRQIFIELLRKQVIGILQARKEKAKSSLKASERPKGVLIKYTELLNKAKKDMFTLSTLEDRNRVLLLEQARKEDPWDLITKPALFPNPVGPRRKIMALQGLLTGFAFGSLITLIDERRKNKIFSFSEMSSYFSCPVLDNLSINEKEGWETSLELIANKILSNSHQSIGLLLIGEIDKSLSDQLKITLSNFIQERQILISSELRDVIKTSTVIIITAIGITERHELININNKLKIQNKSITGLIILS